MRYTQLLGLIARLDYTGLTYDEIRDLNQLLDDAMVCPKNEDNPFEHEYVMRRTHSWPYQVCRYCGHLP